jgi:hypothetical protein
MTSTAELPGTVPSCALGIVIAVIACLAWAHSNLSEMSLTPRRRPGPFGKIQVFIRNGPWRLSDLR